MSKTYEVTKDSQFFIIKELSLGALYLVVVYVVIIYFLPKANILILQIIYFGWWMLTQPIPCCFFHSQYYRHNKATKLIINKVSRTITIVEKEEVFVFAFDDIKSIQLRMCSSLYRGGRRGMNAWERYHYALLEMLDNKRFFITCLLVNDLRKFFKELGLEVQKQKVFLPFIRLKTLQEKMNEK